MTQKQVSILGSTGSIGRQALQIVEQHPDKLSVYALTCGSNYHLLAEQVLKYHPKVVAIKDHNAYKPLKKLLSGTDTTLLVGEEGIDTVAGDHHPQIVLVAIVGFAGLSPTLRAIQAGRTVALANKEALVVGGDLVMSQSREHAAPLIPVDSEHSAIFQCLIGEQRSDLSKVFLTASGGPFVDLPAEKLPQVSPREALKHPNWSMGAKVTIDSATLMNKGLELIEACRLFDLTSAEIEVVVHRQSIIHSMVAFKDGSIKAQLGTPDMRIPIGYALLFPKHADSNVAPLTLRDLATLTFEPPRRQDFPCLDLALAALEEGGTATCILNAANEVAVDRFLKGGLSFVQIPTLIERMLSTFSTRSVHSLEILKLVDQEVRLKAYEWAPPKM